MRACLDQVGLWVCVERIAMITLVDVRRPSPLWEAPFPGLGLLGCVSVVSSPNQYWQVR